MQDKIKMVMEETGCDEGQAQIALEACNYDISKAISKIFDLLKDIVVVKGKFYTCSNHLYGMVVIIVDANHCHHIRAGALASYNPEIYETNLMQNWHEYDKKLYTARLLPGSIQSTTLEMERKIINEITDECNESFFNAIKKNDTMEIADILEDVLREPLKTSAVNFEILLEELNLTQFKKISSKIFSQQQMEFEFKEKNECDFVTAETLTVNVTPVANGKFTLKPGVLLSGDEIAVFITDKRDIAQYISGLIGGRNIYGPVAIPCKIHEVTKSKAGITFTLRLAAGIIGQTTIPEKTMVKVISLTKRTGIFARIFFRFYLIFSELFERIRETRNRHGKQNTEQTRKTEYGTDTENRTWNRH